MKVSEILFISLESLKTNRLRTMLTILGVVVGIFSIIVIMTIMTMLQSSIEEGVSFLNKNTFQIQKWPAIHNHEQMQKYRNRKNITLDEFYRLEKLLTQAKYLGAEQETYGKLIQFRRRETNPNIAVVGVTLGAFKTIAVNIQDGRELTENDVSYSNAVCILGMDIVDKIFPGLDPLDQIIRVDGHPMKVIGVMERRPQVFGDSQDNFVVIPITTYQSFYGRNNQNVAITVMANSKEEYEPTMNAAIGYMRTIRKVDPGEENNFEIFSNESIMSQINDITGGVKIGAVAVSIIALIAAGVGIMNIMLVSVTERTREIGIRKAIGAKKSSILVQFLFEAIVLCVIGGLVGIILGVGIGNFAGSFLDANMAIPVDWIIIGFTLCVLVGVIFGTYPAYKAANLDPIEALRYE